MNNFLIRSYLLVFLFTACLTSCKSTKSTESKYVGVWHYSIEWEGTEYPMKMIISKSDDGYTAMFSSEWGDLNLDDLVIEEDQLTATYDFQGNIVDFKGTFDGDTFIGLSSAGGYEFPMEAERRKE